MFQTSNVRSVVYDGNQTKGIMEIGQLIFEDITDKVFVMTHYLDFKVLGSVAVVYDGNQSKGIMEIGQLTFEDTTDKGVARVRAKRIIGEELGGKECSLLTYVPKVQQVVFISNDWVKWAKSKLLHSIDDLLQQRDKRDPYLFVALLHGPVLNGFLISIIYSNVVWTK